MATDTFACPECHAVLRRALTLQAGETVMCPRCLLQFPCPDAQTTPGAGVTEVKPPCRPAFPAPPTAFTETPAVPRAPADDDDAPPLPLRPRELPPVFHDAEEDEDYPRPPPGMLPFDPFQHVPLEPAAWFRCAREHWGNMLGGTVGFCIVYCVIHIGVSIVPCIGFAVALFLLPPIQAGVSIVALDELKGKRWTFSAFFSGFHWGGAIIGVAFYTLLMSLLLLPLMVFLIHLVEFPNWIFLNLEETLVLAGGCALGASAFAFLYTRLITFALPLVLDRNYGASSALAGSWALTRGRFWELLGLNLLMGLINLGGALCFVFGLIFTLPFTALVWNAAYLLLAGTQPPVSRELRSRQDQQRYDAF